MILSGNLHSERHDMIRCFDHTMPPSSRSRGLAVAGLLIRYGCLTLMMAVGGVPVAAQDVSRLSACLGSPTQSCALSAAVATAVAEELPIERARVLIAVAKALAAIGDRDQTLATLQLALEETRGVGINFVLQEKLKDIVPIYARIGAGEQALALAQQIDVRIIREQVMSAVLEAAYAQGDLDTAAAAIAGFQNPSRAFWEELNLRAQGPAPMITKGDIAGYAATVAGLTRPDQKARGYTLLAVLAHKMGDIAGRDGFLVQAADSYDRTINPSSRAAVGALRVEALFRAGITGDAFDAAYRQARIEGGRLRAPDEAFDFARRFGPIEVARGDVAAATARLDQMDSLEQQAVYLAALGPVASPAIDRFFGGAPALLAASGDRFERDRLRLLLVEAAVSQKRADLALVIVRGVEDDDAQAAALASVAPIL